MESQGSNDVRKSTDYCSFVISTIFEISIDTALTIPYFYDYRIVGASPVKPETVIRALAALAQEHRLAAFRALVQAGAGGMPAGKLAEALGVPNSSLSFHLSQLTQAGLIQQTRSGRSLIYSADYAAMNLLVGYLMENCCAGAVCAPEQNCSPSPVFEERKIA
jgi:ArsR family transcriptional regulator, arsenate/arsenite/antimonite-responsive transcriptional repressor